MHVCAVCESWPFGMTLNLWVRCHQYDALLKILLGPDCSYVRQGIVV